MIYSDKEIAAQLKELSSQRDSLGLNDWEMKFVEDNSQLPPWKTFSAKQKEVIGSLWDKYLGNKR